MRNILIVIPVYNAADHLERCLDSVVRHLDDNTRVLVVDDASPDPHIAEIMCKHDCVERRYQQDNQGFVATANSGMRSALAHGEHCLLLNSDTVVTPGWLDRMRACLDSDPTIGIVTPLSNAATIYSVPSVHERPLPSWHTPDTMAELVSRLSARLYPRAPTGHGFAMLIRHEVLTKIGVLDAAFGRGYGEEVDYSLRARAAGYSCAICDDAYVYHATGASFGADGHTDTPARKHNSELIRTRWPNYEREVRAHHLVDPLRVLRNAIARELYAPKRRTGKPRVLSIVHTLGSNGGTELHTEEMTAHLRRRGYDARILTPRASLDRQLLEYVHMFDGKLVPASPVIYGVRAAHDSRLVARALRETLEGLRPDTVHVQHPLGYGLINMTDVVHAAGAKCVISIHDYYYLCPRYNLARADNLPCGQARMTSCDECYDCAGKAFASRDAFAACAEQRGIAAAAGLCNADAIVCVSDFARNALLRAYDIDPNKVHVIRYGFALAPQPRVPRASRLRVTVLGNLTPIKGLDDVRAISRELRDTGLSSSIRLEVRGGVPPGVNDVTARPYNHGDLPKVLANTDVVLVTSRVHETFCRVVDEALYCGVPVIAPRAGAIPERVAHGVNGMLYEIGDWRGALGHLCAIASSRQLLDSLAQGARSYERRTPEVCHAEYAALYTKVLSAR